MAIPVILDTDIGLDVDDVWALAFLLKCPELDVRLVLTGTGDARSSAALVAKLLERAGRTDIPIGIGISTDPSLPRTHATWLGDYDIVDYSGTWHEDGVGALIDTVKASPGPLTIIGIGPTRNLASALQRAPEIIDKACLIGMLGSLRIGYAGAPEAMREYNVFKDASASQAALRAKWDKTLVPLDICGTVSLRGDRFARLLESDDPLVRAVLENHFLWVEAVRAWPGMKEFDPQAGSSFLYDTVPVYLAFADELISFEQLNVHVSDDGWTRIDTAGAPMRCATEWKDKEGFLDLLTDRLTGAKPVKSGASKKNVHPVV